MYALILNAIGILLIAALAIAAIVIGGRNMSDLSDRLDTIQTKMNEVATAQAEASTSQTAAIARVEALIAALPPPVTPEDIAKLDALNAQLDMLKTVEAAQKAEADAERPDTPPDTPPSARNR